MARENRIVKPFHGTDAFEDLLRSSAIQIGPRSFDGNCVISSREYINEPLAFVLGSEPNTLVAQRELCERSATELGMELGDLDIAISVRSNRLRTTSVFRHCLADETTWTGRFSIGSGLEDGSPQALKAPRGGCRLRVAVILNKAMPPAPLSPTRLFAILAEKSFLIRTPDSGNFVPQFLTNEVRELHELHKSTSIYVDAAEVTTDAAKVDLFVDQPLLEALQRSQSTPAGQALADRLFLRVIGAVASAAVKEIGNEASRVTANQVPQNSIAGRLVRAVAQKTGLPEDECRTCMVRDEARFVSLAEALLVKTRRHWIELLGGDDDVPDN